MRFVTGDLHKSVFVFRYIIVFTQSRSGRTGVVLSHLREHLTATKIHETDEPSQRFAIIKIRPS